MNDLLLHLALILIGAELGALLARAARMPTAVGQIGAGLVLGQSLLGIVTPGPVLSAIAEVGALCVLAIAGVETDLAVMRRVGRPATLAALGGVILPFVGGVGLALAAGKSPHAALFVGAIMTATSVGVTAAVLGEFGLLRSTPGTTILGAAVIDDVLGLVVLGLVVALATGSGANPITVVVPMLLTLAVAGLLLRHGQDHLGRALSHLHDRGAGQAVTLGLILLAGWAVQVAGGLAAITGTYLAGVALGGTPVADRVRERLAHVGETVFVPAFFVAIGFQADLHSLMPALPLAVGLIVLGVVGKIMGSGLGAALGGLDGQASLLVGIGMIARGEVALVAASVAREAGVIGPGLYAASVLLALATTLITPIGIAGWARLAERRARTTPTVLQPDRGPRAALATADIDR